MATDREWPATRWALSAPESIVLLNGPGASGTEAFKLALEELVARSRLAIAKIRERRFIGHCSETAIVAAGNRASDRTELPAPLREIERLYYDKVARHSYADGTYGAPVVEVARAGVREYRSLASFTKRVVLPSLAGRGFHAIERSKLLGLIPRTTYVLTATGQQARDELEAWLQVERERFAPSMTRLASVSPSPAPATTRTGMSRRSLIPKASNWICRRLR